ARARPLCRLRWKRLAPRAPASARLRGKRGRRRRRRDRGRAALFRSRRLRGGVAGMTTVAIVDYGSGNLRSAAKAFERAAADAGVAATVAVTSHAEDVRRADRVVLPGVGAFADCKAGLDALAGMVEALEEAVVARGRPFLGIC